MKSRLYLSLLVLPFMVHARIPRTKDTKVFSVQYDIGVCGDTVHLSTPSLTLDGEVVACHCGKRATSISIVKGKIVGLCLQHESYVPVSAAHDTNFCTACGSKATAANITDKK